MIFLLLATPPLTFGLFGVIFLIIHANRTHKIKDWDLTRGKIIKKGNNIEISLANILKKGSYRSNTPDHAPTVVYKIDGITYESTSTFRQSPGIRPGTIVEVYYNPDQPSEAIINTFIQRGTLFKIIGWIMLGVGIALAIGTLVIFLLNK